MQIKRTDLNDPGPCALYIGLKEDGTYFGDVMQTVYEAPQLWRHTVKEFRVWLHPGPKQLEKIIAALNSGSIRIDDLKRIEGKFGGYGSLVISDPAQPLPPERSPL